MFANGEKVLTVDAAALGGYRFISEITGLDTVSLGATKGEELINILSEEISIRSKCMRLL